MARMESAFWEQVAAGGHRVPTDRPLAELTAELTTMLGDPDPYLRDEIALSTLVSWVFDGVYDDLLEGLGDGMAAGLTVGLGEQHTDTVFRRSFSALVLAACIERSNGGRAVPDEALLRWGDRLAGWFVRERDLRGFVPGKGWAHAVAHGADALGALAQAPSFGRLELTVLLDVVADRLLAPTTARLVHGEDDRLAAATMTVLRRDVVPLEVLEPWVARLATSARPVADGPADPYLVSGNVSAFLRALHLHLALAGHPPACRTDLLLVLIGHLRATTPQLDAREPTRRGSVLSHRGTDN
jgi:Protein of unknown function (DUF2785)